MLMMKSEIQKETKKCYNYPAGQAASMERERELKITDWRPFVRSQFFGIEKNLVPSKPSTSIPKTMVSLKSILH